MLIDNCFRNILIIRIFGVIYLSIYGETKGLRVKGWGLEVSSYFLGDGLIKGRENAEEEENLFF